MPPAILTSPPSRVQFIHLLLVSLLALAHGLFPSAHAQERFSLFVPTEQEDVTRMLKLAGLKDGDMVYDLGSGDGRIVFEAAKMNPNVRGRGIEIDEKLVKQSRLLAETSGLAERVEFIHQNAFDADLAEADIIAMWLWPELMRMLRPKILAEARPGTRIVTRIWDLGSWKPDATDTEGAELFMWVVPAKIAGYWSWSLDTERGKHEYAAVVEQHFQAVEGVVRSGSRRALLDGMKINGDAISFSTMMTLPGIGLTKHQFSGRVNGDVIEGTVQLLYEPYETPFERPWRAVRSATTAYFAPTGTDAK